MLKVNSNPAFCGNKYLLSIKYKKYFLSSLMYHSLYALYTQNHKFEIKYLILLSISLRVVGVWVVLEELSHIRHDGFLIWLVYIHICRARQTCHAHLMKLTLEKHTANLFQASKGHVSI